MKKSRIDHPRAKLPEIFSPMLSVSQVSAITGQKEGVVRSWFEVKYGRKKRRKLPCHRTTENPNSAILIYYKDLQYFLLNVLFWPVDFVDLWVRQMPEEQQELFRLCEQMHKEKQNESLGNSRFPEEEEFFMGDNS